MKLLIKFFLISIILCLTAFLVIHMNGMSGSLVSESIAVEESHAEDEGEDDEETRVLIIDGYKAIQLDEDTVTASGLEFKQVETTYFKPESIAYADVIDIEPLVTSKTEYEAILAQQRILINDLHNHNKILQRAEALHKAKSLSTRDLEKNRADRDLKSSQLSAVNTRLTSIKYKVKSFWGNEIAGYMFDQDMLSELDALMSYNKLLILLSLPKGKTLENKEQKVFVNNTNKRETSFPATYFDKANRVSNPLYGESYIYSTNAENLRVGTRLFAWLEESGENIEGLFIPESAVVWYANEPWIYLKHGDDLFIRKPLGDARKINQGWFLENNTLIGSDLVVTRGGQTLLSEEFKWAIPDEDDD